MTESVRPFTYKKIDEITIRPDKLTETISNLSELGYVAGVEPTMWKSMGYYGTEYRVGVFKKELRE